MTTRPEGGEMSGLQLVMALGKVLGRSLGKMPPQHPLLITICLLLVIVALGTQVTFDGDTWNVVYEPTRW